MIVIKNIIKLILKKLIKKKYKIKSVNVQYAVFDNKTDEFKNFIYRNYPVKNKNNFIVNISNNNSISFVKLTVNYQSSGKIKKESVTSSYSKAELLVNTYGGSDKSNVHLFQKIYLKSDFKYPFVIKYQKIKVVTKNKKYKIKAIKLALSDVKSNKISYSTFKGYGKNSLKIQLYQNKAVQGIKVYYY